MRLLRQCSAWIGGDEIDDTDLVIAATRDEFVLLANSLNEALEAVDRAEFDDRLGGTPEEARALRSKIGEVLRETRPKE